MDFNWMTKKYNIIGTVFSLSNSKYKWVNINIMWRIRDTYSNETKPETWIYIRRKVPTLYYVHCV